VVERYPALSAGHYYLGMNLGQLARTKTLGALRIVDEMEREFSKARKLDEKFDYAGPDRNLGILYCEAPTFGSIGDRKKALEHMERAVAVAPDYPDNRLSLIEACLKWNERERARAQVKALRKLWVPAKKNLTGEEWKMSWIDWQRRLEAAEKKLR
jgi:hypothetical protein